MKCRICEISEGSPHSFYGANLVCTSCRGFFMRSVQSGQYLAFKSHARKGCMIDSKTRRSCRKCRFDKCLAAGMKVSYVKSPEGDQIQRSHKVMQFALTHEEMDNLRSICSQQIQFLCKKTFQLYASAIDVFYRHYASDWSEKSFIPDQDVNSVNQMDHAIVACVSHWLMENENLSWHDKCILVQNNNHKIQTFLAGTMYQEDYFSHELFQFGSQYRHECHEVELVMQHYDQMFPDSSQGPNFVFEPMYSTPWACHVSYENEHRRIMKGIYDWRCQTAGSPQVDLCILTLVFFILLYSTDGIRKHELRNQREVERVQLKYTYWLRKYLEHKSAKKDLGCYAKAIMLSHETSRAFELSKKRLLL